jgi:hypothetical protein
MFALLQPGPLTHIQPISAVSPLLGRVEPAYSTHDQASGVEVSGTYVPEAPLPEPGPAASAATDEAVLVAPPEHHGVAAYQDALPGPTEIAPLAPVVGEVPPLGAAPVPEVAPLAPAAEVRPFAEVPVAEVAPLMPVAEVAPLVPVAEVTPLAEVAPLAALPVAEVARRMPVAEVAPLAPVHGEVEPLAPVAEVTPLAPAPPAETPVERPARASATDTVRMLQEISFLDE